jgi:mycothiol synthase
MFELRPATLADAPEVLRVLQARDVADLGEPDFTLEDLLDQWHASEFDLTSDVVLAVGEEEAVIGCATLWTQGALAVVDPAREGEGVGSALLSWVERRVRETERGVARQWVASSNATGHELLGRAGYRHIRSYWRLARRLEPGLRAPEPPPGVTIVAVKPEADARALYEANEAAFATTADYEPESFAAFRGEHLAAHDFDPSLSLVARRGSRVEGFLLSRRWAQEGVGFVDLLGVEPSGRSRGLGSALLLGAFAAFAAAGLREAQLGVASDNPSALKLYEGVGMAPRHRADVLEKAL